MANTPLIISFGTTEGTGEFSANISLDDDYNTIVYGDAKNSFDSTDIVYLRMLPPYSEENYTLSSSYGVLTKVSTGISYPIIEFLDFVNEKEKELSLTPTGSVTYEWVGNSFGIPLFSNKIVTVPSKVVGRLKCTYNALGDRLKLVTSSGILSEDGYQVICAVLYVDSDKDTSVSVSFNGTGATRAKIKVVVKNICDNTVIAGASVSIPGIESGVTNSEGEFLTTVEGVVGQSYDIIISASGFTASSSDFLRNDSFVLSDPTD